MTGAAAEVEVLMIARYPSMLAISQKRKIRFCSFCTPEVRSWKTTTCEMTKKEDQGNNFGWGGGSGFKWETHQSTIPNL
jgi:hypothetical protein